jgi:hypothetical protein
MLFSHTDEIAGRLADFLAHHIHNISPRHSRRRRYRNTLATLRPTLSRRSPVRINPRRRKTRSSRDSRKLSTILTRHMPRCTPNRNRMSRTMPRRTMMATTAMAECPCPHHTRPSVRISNSETTNARSLEPITGSSQRILSNEAMHCFACKHGARCERLEIARSNRTRAQRAFIQIRGKAVSAAPESHCLDTAESRQAQPGQDSNLEKGMFRPSNTTNNTTSIHTI